MMEMSTIVLRFENDPGAFPEDLQGKIATYQRKRSHNRADESKLLELRARVAGLRRTKEERLAGLRRELEEARAVCAAELAALKEASHGFPAARMHWEKLNGDFERMRGRG